MCTSEKKFPHVIANRELFNTKFKPIYIVVAEMTGPKDVSFIQRLHCMLPDVQEPSSWRW